MILFLTPTALEQRYIKNEPWLSKKIIGIGDNCLKYKDLINQNHYKVVVLFGMCGLLKRKLPFLGTLYVLTEVNTHSTGDEHQQHGFEATAALGVTTKKAIHDKEDYELLNYFGYDTVDLESVHILDVCTRPLIIIRYGIDYCDKKLVRFPFNRAMRSIQHYLAQREMNKALDQIWYEGGPLNV